MSSFPKLPHVEAGTNLVVLNALETVVENNVERVFDFIVAEDVVVFFRKTSPAIVAVENQTGTWNHPGAVKFTNFNALDSACEALFFIELQTNRLKMGTDTFFIDIDGLSN